MQNHCSVAYLQDRQLEIIFGFGQSFGQVSVSVSVSAETQNCGFGRLLVMSQTLRLKSESVLNKALEIYLR